jgi:hypothetical protein
MGKISIHWERSGGGLRPVVERKPSSVYPYLVTRYMAAVYGHEPIRFVKHTSDAIEKGLNIKFDDPYENGKLRKEAIAAIITIVKRKCRQDGHRRCIVLSKKEAIYVEPNGEIKRRIGARVVPSATIVA